MRCFFGHNWGKVENGYQHCTKCNKARNIPAPHPCDNRHTWEDDERFVTNVRDGWDSWQEVSMRQVCKVCGESRTIDIK